MDTLQDLLFLYQEHPTLRTLTALSKDNSILHIQTDGLYGSSQSLILANLFLQTRHSLLILSDSVDDAIYLDNDLTLLLGEDKVCFFPSPYRIRQRKQDTDTAYEIERTTTLNHLTSQRQTPCIVVSYPEALIPGIITKQQFQDEVLALHTGQSISIEQLSTRLFNSGWEKVDFVYEPGQFSIRGGIVDIFSFSSENPYRIDFFGDEIDSIRIFDIESQLSKEKVSDIEIIPNIQEQPSAEQTHSLFDYLPDNTIIVSNDFSLLRHKFLSASSGSETNGLHRI
ncbi:MAG TPA: transcription-repair coupling factor, partial [Bacteroidales bacterium]|nr:transcription-repair coupling factor [Bacteroidales bacterium]